MFSSCVHRVTICKRMANISKNINSGEFESHPEHHLFFSLGWQHFSCLSLTFYDHNSWKNGQKRLRTLARNNSTYFYSGGRLTKLFSSRANTSEQGSCFYILFFLIESPVFFRSKAKTHFLLPGEMSHWPGKKFVLYWWAPQEYQKRELYAWPVSFIRGTELHFQYTVCKSLTLTKTHTTAI